MFSSDNFWLVLVIINPSLVLKFLSKLLKSSTSVHQIFIGKSPFVIVQTADTASSRFISSSPNVNGFIWGKTWKYRISFNFVINNSRHTLQILFINDDLEKVELRAKIFTIVLEQIAKLVRKCFKTQKYAFRICSPLICKMVLWCVPPPLFFATQVKLPTCLAPTASMLIMLILGFVLVITIPSLDDNVFSWPFISTWIQAISIGKSPLLTVHVADIISSRLIWSAPKSNGTICGKTCIYEREMWIILLLSKQWFHSVLLMIVTFFWLFRIIISYRRRSLWFWNIYVVDLRSLSFSSWVNEISKTFEIFLTSYRIQINFKCFKENKKKFNLPMISTSSDPLAEYPSAFFATQV